MTTIDKFRDAVTNQYALSRKVVWTGFAWGLVLLPIAFTTILALIPVTRESVRVVKIID
jgi:hypothetical protein